PGRARPCAMPSAPGPRARASSRSQEWPVPGSSFAWSFPSCLPLLAGDEHLLLPDEDARTRMIDEAPLIFEQGQAGRAAGLGGRPGRERIGVVPPELREPVVRLLAHVTTRRQRCIERMVERVQLDVAANAEGGCVPCHERSVLLTPVAMERRGR